MLTSPVPTRVMAKSERVPLLKPGHNVWRAVPTERAAVLIDAGAYFGALREALLNARRSVFLLGWDIDSHTRLVGEQGCATDGLPEEFMPLLTALAERNKNLQVYLLIWDYSILYAFEREFPVLPLHWQTPSRVRFCLDDHLPLGASHHQKLVVVDDALAFVGGLDVTSRRWDTREHRSQNPQRIDPNGTPYPPFHDVQVMLDGEAARALGGLARERWRRGACERPPRVAPLGDPWPQSITPDLTGIRVGIARTVPALDDFPQIREVETLFLDAIDCAERTIYIENQFLTAQAVAHRLVNRMRSNRELEVLVIAPRTCHSWLENQTMEAGLARFMRTLEPAKLRDRFQLLGPRVLESGHPVDIMVHSKVMVVDDRWLRIGSANLNNRSFALDTECDVMFEATNDAHRQAIEQVRNALLAHHCGVRPSQVAEFVNANGSLIGAARALHGPDRRLKPITVAQKLGPVSTLEALGDPEAPISPPEFLAEFVGTKPTARRVASLARLIGGAVAIAAIALIWQVTPLSDWLNPDAVQEALHEIDSGTPFAPLVVIGTYLAATLLFFPVTLLIAAAGALFGPWLGFGYALVGTVLSAAISFQFGAVIGRRRIDAILGPRLNRIRRRLIDRGLLAVTGLRLVPVAPFTVVNIAAGASRLRFVDFMLGTLIGMLPGMLLMTAFGHQIFVIMTEPTLFDTGLLAGLVLGWIGVILLAQFTLLRLRRKDK